MEGIVVVGDGIALLLFPVEGGQHLIQQLPAPLPGEDQVAVLQPAAGFFHDVHGLVQAHLQMGFLREQGIVRTHDGAGPGMDGHDAVVLGDLLGEGEDLVFLGIAVGLIHKAEGAAEGAALHGLPYMGEFLLDLLRCEGRGIVAGDAGADGALADQRHQIDKEPPLGPLFKLRKAAGGEGVEQAAADLIPVGRVGVDAEGREAAVAGDLGGDALLNKGLVILLRVLPVVEEIVVGVGVDQTGADLQSRQIHHLVGDFLDLASNLKDPLVLNEHVAYHRGGAAAVVDAAVFE